MSCPEDLQQGLLDGRWLDSMRCVYTGGDPTMELVVPMFVYGAVMIALYRSSGTIAMPTVVGIIFAGVMLAALPATAMTLVTVALVLTVSVGAFLIARRLQI